MNGIDRERQAAASIKREFPGWTAWVGVDNLWHARRTGIVPKPGDIVTGEDDEDLRDMIKTWIRTHS